MIAAARSWCHAPRLERRRNSAIRAAPSGLTHRGSAYLAQNRSAVRDMSLPMAATQTGPRISSNASRRAIDVLRRDTIPERILTIRLSASPGPRVSSRCSPSGCNSGSRANTRESSRSLLVCLW